MVELNGQNIDATVCENENSTEAIHDCYAWHDAVGKHILADTAALRNMSASNFLAGALSFFLAWLTQLSLLLQRVTALTFMQVPRIMAQPVVHWGCCTCTEWNLRAPAWMPGHCRCRMTCKTGGLHRTRQGSLQCIRVLR